MVTAEAINGVMKFIGGVAVGWWMHAVKREGERPPTAAAAAKKKKAGVSVGRPRAVARPATELKMVLCVNTGLGMGKGKIGENLSVFWGEGGEGGVGPQRAAADQHAHLMLANDASLCSIPHQPAGAQCAHAAVGVMGRYRGKHEMLFKQWELCGQPKIALKVKDEAEMVRAFGDLGEAAVYVPYGMELVAWVSGACSW